MKVSEFLKVYKNDGVVQTIAEAIKPNENHIVRLKGISGRLDAVLSDYIFVIINHKNFFFMQDK